jgi:hypothetical protein
VKNIARIRTSKTNTVNFLSIPREDELGNDELLKRKYGDFIAVGGCSFKKPRIRK